MATIERCSMYSKKQDLEEIMQRNNINYAGMRFIRLSSNAGIFSTESKAYVVYHRTLVFAYDNNQAQLQTDGWHTNTTKKWINYGLALVNLGKFIKQRKHNWYLMGHYGNVKAPFEDGMTVI